MRFDYHLPEEAIAQQPTEPRSAARLLVDLDAARPPRHATVADLPGLLEPGDVLVVNETRVLPARLGLRKPTGGAAEVLLLEREPAGTWTALVRPGRRLAPGTTLVAADGTPVVRVGPPVDGDGTRRVELLADPADHGTVPLPPYIREPLADPGRYQTVYARTDGSVAAPTAGLHLTTEVLDALRLNDVAVHTVDLAVGLGTFRPLAGDRLDDHRMHEERYAVPAATLEACRAAAGRVVAVGTTTLRALESAARPGGTLEGRTDLFIRPGFDFRVVDVLMTNFHQPRSTLLVLLSAFAGDERWRARYAEALAEGYRFLSFGDAMLVSRA
ncbi:MAG TPA: tRNA preQ1(34) S-adenosylmethionine ribosyltransferase-isomerase QueA [Acidimicrobiales bacterium]|nr:tRNA preQ1(34) S-adenosylmethionine ribosyltransferase-isomerase QueA [Acidimicrobiales bacterium]